MYNFIAFTGITATSYLGEIIPNKVAHSNAIMHWDVMICINSNGITHCDITMDVPSNGIQYPL